VALIHISLLLGCAVAIYLACEWFVNAVEWLGVRLKMGTLAIGFRARCDRDCAA
jgi:cation:H+ antiporter